MSTLTDSEWLSSAHTITEQKTKIRKLDDIILEEMPQDPIGFIKIDVEGYELKALSGATTVLREHRPNLQIEIDPANLDQVCGMMNSLGYTGLFFFEGREHDIRQFRLDRHRNPRHAWSPEKANEFDLEEFVVNFFFIPQH